MRGLFLLSLMVLGGCQTTASRPLPAGAIAPAEAVIAAADAAPGSIRGLFALQVRATGRQSGRIYLNSEKDYRDQRNISIDILPVAFKALRTRFGDWPDRALAGKTIHVRGAARRVRIDFIENGRPSGKYYYQTHINVTQANQITLVE